MSLKHCNNEMYSASQVLNSMMVCNLELHMIGQLEKVITYKDCDLAVLGSSVSICLYQLPAKSVSAYTSEDFSRSGASMIPSLFVCCRYLDRCLTASM